MVVDYSQNAHSNSNDLLPHMKIGFAEDHRYLGIPLSSLLQTGLIGGFYSKCSGLTFFIGIVIS